MQAGVGLGVGGWGTRVEQKRGQGRCGGPLTLRWGDGASGAGLTPPKPRQFFLTPGYRPRPSKRASFLRGPDRARSQGVLPGLPRSPETHSPDWDSSPPSLLKDTLLRTCSWLCWIFLLPGPLSSCSERGPLLAAVLSLLVAAAPLVAKRRLSGTRASVAAVGSAGSRALGRRLRRRGARAWLLRSPWDLPQSAIKPASPASAGRFSTTEPQGKPRLTVFRQPTPHCLLSDIAHLISGFHETQVPDISLQGEFSEIMTGNRRIYSERNTPQTACGPSQKGRGPEIWGLGWFSWTASFLRLMSRRMIPAIWGKEQGFPGLRAWPFMVGLGTCGRVI